MTRINSGLVLLVCLTIAVGCRSHTDRLMDARTAFYDGNTDRAAEHAQKRIDEESRFKDQDVLKLDLAIIELARGNAAQSEKLLREVRDQFDYLEDESGLELGLSTFTDDHAIAYAGEDYEKLLIRAFLSLANMMHDGGDALAYAHQVTQKQHRIIQAGASEEESNPKASYKKLALGPYIYGMLKEQTHQNYDDAARAYQQVVSWEPGFESGAGDLSRVSTGTHSSPGNGVLYVFTLVGRGPYKVPRMEMPTTAAIAVADRILTVTGKYSLPPTLAPIQVPTVVRVPTQIQGVEVVVDGKSYGLTETITDVSELAEQQYAAVFDRVVARAVVRRIVKKGTVVAAKAAMLNSDDMAVNLVMDLSGALWEATENADTRCWGLLPDRIEVRRVELPKGMHQVRLQAVSHQSSVAPEYVQPVEILDGRNTFVLANFPEQELVGKISVSVH